MSFPEARLTEARVRAAPKPWGPYYNDQMKGHGRCHGAKYGYDDTKDVGAGYRNVAEWNSSKDGLSESGSLVPGVRLQLDKSLPQVRFPDPE